MTTLNTCNPSTEQENQPVELKKTIYFSSRTPLHYFKLNNLVWGTRNLLQCVETKPKMSKKSTPVSKPCIKAKRCKRQSCLSPVNKVLERVRERSVRRREGLFSLSLRKQDIDQDFIRVTGKMPVRKIKVKKVFSNADEEQEYINYQKYLKEIVPGNWLSEMYRV